jgi:peptidoglycan/LPS O-acetylase OafA/YrhL
MARRLPHVNGRRGAFQLLFAFIHFFVGVSFITAPAASSRTAAIGYLGDWTAPLACLWLVSAGLAIVAAFLCRPRDWFGFAALVIAPGIWGFLFLAGVLFAGGPILGILSTAIYWVFGACSMIVSGMQGESDRDNREVSDAA